MRSLLERLVTCVSAIGLLALSHCDDSTSLQESGGGVSVASDAGSDAHSGSTSAGGAQNASGTAGETSAAGGQAGAGSQGGGGAGGICEARGWEDSDSSANGTAGAGGTVVTCHESACARPICGKDHQFHETHCEVDRDPWGGCGTLSSDYFLCGEFACRVGVDYCARQIGALGWGRCKALPSVCLSGADLCACIDYTREFCGPRAQLCTQCDVKDGNLILSHNIP